MRCEWAKSSMEIEYHDTFWGVPCHDETALFEMVILEGMQAGLSWATILAKREHMASVMDNFDYNKIAVYSDEYLDKLLLDPGIVRNKGKVAALRTNALAFLDVQKKFGSFDSFIWSFTDGKPIVNAFESIKEVPAKTAISEKMSKELIKLGFKFIGPVICYAFMQSVGITNDHIITCKEYEKCLQKIKI